VLLAPCGVRHLHHLALYCMPLRAPPRRVRAPALLLRLVMPLEEEQQQLQLPLLLPHHSGLELEDASTLQQRRSALPAVEAVRGRQRLKKHMRQRCKTHQTCLQWELVRVPPQQPRLPCKYTGRRLRLVAAPHCSRSMGLLVWLPHQQMYPAKAGAPAPGV
jgi:hypothetical protein